MNPEQLLENDESLELGSRETHEGNADNDISEESIISRMIVKDGFIFILLSPEERLALYLRRKELGIEAEEILAQWLRNVLILDYPPNQILNGSHLIAYYRKAYEKLLQRQDFLLYVLQNATNNDTTMTDILLFVLQNLTNNDITVPDIISSKHRLILDVLGHLRERKHKSTLNSYQILQTNLYSYYCAIAKQRQIELVSSQEFWGICGNLLNEKLDWSCQQIRTGTGGMNDLQSLLNRIGKIGEKE
ncbi:MAG: hypothetical protein ACE5OZ_07265 [Candidatus Heimdallarchaeota archaeon]